MSIGIAVTKQQLDADMGALALELARTMRRLTEMQQFFNITPDATLTTLSYTPAEITVLRSGWGTDGPQLVSIYQGQAALPAAKDFRANIGQMAGDGQT